MASNKHPALPATDDTGDDTSSTPDADGASTNSSPHAEEQPTPQADEPPLGHPFMNWMRQLDLRREHGWIGGVAAGIATRLAIDPLIVRGILVVVAVLGGPAILLYAAAWLLVADQNDSIHLENFFRRKIERAHAGIAGLLVLSMLPTAQGFWGVGSFVAGPPSWGTDVARALWTVLLIAGLAALVVWIARLARSSSSAPYVAPIVVPATTNDDPSTVPEPHISSDSSDFSSDAGTLPMSVTALAAHPPADASAQDVAAWREQRELWKAQSAAWKAQQQVDAQAIRRQRTAEARERAQSAAAAAAARHRERRRLSPRLPAAIQAVVIGLALVGYGITAVVSTSASNSPPVAAATGLAVALLIFGFAIVIGGILRRRSAFLGFIAGVTVLAAVVAFALPENRTLVLPSATLSEGRTAQPWGKAYINTLQSDPATIYDVWQGAGELEVFINEGTTVTFDVRSPQSSVCIANLQSEENSEGFAGEYDCRDPSSQTNEFDRWQVTIGDPEASDFRTIHLWQQRGRVVIYNDNPTAP
ncbi:MAG: PspC domain-containing protein [Rhodoglobus sp.]